MTSSPIDIEDIVNTKNNDIGLSTVYDELSSIAQDDIENIIENVNSIGIEDDETLFYSTTNSITNNDINGPINPLRLSHLRLENNDMEVSNEKYTLFNAYISKLIDYLHRNYPVNPPDKTQLKNFHKYDNKLLKELQFSQKPRNVKINYMARKMIQDNIISMNEYYLLLNMTLGKKSRTQSGIMQVTVVTSPGDFSCAYDCYFCPKQEGMPRSYPKEGPSMRRASAWGFDTVKQIQGRISSYDLMGHPVYGCKSELIILGGTWSSYSMEYRRTFMTECYYAYNTYYDDKTKPSRPMLSLEEEKSINTNALCSIIGATVETRADCITHDEIDSFMDFGVTRVQIGIQHTNNKILKKINRQCTIEQCMIGIKMLKDSGFKVLIHLMPNLPGSSPELDREMFHEILTNPMLNFDEVKIYPTVVPTTSVKDSNSVDTVIEKWFLDGKYIPYSNDELIEVLIEVKSVFPIDKRISRLFRDIPQPNTLSGGEIPHMREVIKKEMDCRGLSCRCIRCREIKDHSYSSEDIILDIKEFEASEGKEYFISFVVPNKKIVGETFIIGFCRLRLPYQSSYDGKMHNTAFIRELHVYSQMLSHQTDIDKRNTVKSSQHKGIGKKLIQHAESIASESNFDTIVVISGVGVRDYYRKLGYCLNDRHYMEKSLIKILSSFTLDIIYAFMYVMAFIMFDYQLVTIILYGLT